MEEVTIEKDKVATAEAITTKDATKVENNSETTKNNENKINSEDFISAVDMLQMDITSVPCLFAPIIPKVGLGILGGESDAGKSMILRQLAICTALGCDFIGFPYQGNHGGVLYVSTEDAMEPSAAFLKKQFFFFNKEPKELRGLYFLFSDNDVVEKITARLKKDYVELVIVDSLGDLYDADVNASTYVRKFLKPFKKIAIEHNCFILFLHHIGKSHEGIPSKNWLVGSQSFEAAVRVCFLLVKDSIFDEYRHFCIAKHNYLGPEYKRESYHLRLKTDFFIFEQTGHRFPINQLNVSNSNFEKRHHNFKSISTYDDDEGFIRFVNNNLRTPVSKTDLLKLLKEHYKCGQDKANFIIQLFLDNRWIKNENNQYVSDFQYEDDFSSGNT